MKIFGIGLAKTGTTTLAAALEILGFNAVHDHAVLERISAEARAGRYPQEELDRADAFCDWPHPGPVFAKVAKMVPGSRVILTTRPAEAWLNSCLLHVLHSRVTGTSPWTEIDTAALASERAELYAAAVTWGDRNPGRLLVYDVRDGWEPLCVFLDRPIPKHAFPNENGSRRKLLELLEVKKS